MQIDLKTKDNPGMQVCTHNPCTKDMNNASLGYISRLYLQLIKVQLTTTTAAAAAVVKGQPKHQINAHEKSKSHVNITLGLRFKALKNKWRPCTTIKTSCCIWNVDDHLEQG